MDTAKDTVVFDVGKVLLEWDPRYLYRKLIPDAAEMERFLAEVCTPDWNVEQDRGRSFAEGVAMLTARFPEKAALIEAFDRRWEETIPHAVAGSVTILQTLHAAGVPLYAITNFSSEKFTVARRRFPFFSVFRGIVVSGEERVIKPDAKIYQIFFDRYGVDPAKAVFIDDSLKNVAGAKAVGMEAIHFLSADDLRRKLRAHGFPV